MEGVILRVIFAYGAFGDLLDNNDVPLKVRDVDTDKNAVALKPFNGRILTEYVDV